MKTIALSEATWEKLKRMRESEDLENFDKVIPKSMFGVEKGAKPYSAREHRDFQGEFHEQ